MVAGAQGGLDSNMLWAILGGTAAAAALGGVALYVAGRCGVLDGVDMGGFGCLVRGCVRKWEKY